MTTRTIDTFSQNDVFARAARARTSRRLAGRIDWAGIAMIAFVIAAALLHLASGVLDPALQASTEISAAIVGP